MWFRTGHIAQHNYMCGCEDPILRQPPLQIFMLCFCTAGDSSDSCPKIFHIWVPWERLDIINSTLAAQANAKGKWWCVGTSVLLFARILRIWGFWAAFCEFCKETFKTLYYVFALSLFLACSWSISIKFGWSFGSALRLWGCKGEWIFCSKEYWPVSNLWKTHRCIPM